MCAGTVSTESLNPTGVNRTGGETTVAKKGGSSSRTPTRGPACVRPWSRTNGYGSGHDVLLLSSSRNPPAPTHKAVVQVNTVSPDAAPLRPVGPCRDTQWAYRLSRLLTPDIEGGNGDEKGLDSRTKTMCQKSNTFPHKWTSYGLCRLLRSVLALAAWLSTLDIGYIISPLGVAIFRDLLSNPLSSQWSEHMTSNEQLMNSFQLSPICCETFAYNFHYTLSRYT